VVCLRNIENAAPYVRYICICICVWMLAGYK